MIRSISVTKKLCDSIGRRFRNGFKEEGTIELCLGREAEIGQEEKRDGWQSLKVEGGWERHGIFGA